ncbi:MAG: tRNA (guanosine(37)-N1)-methyltransferase TrmD [Candidatus Magasanikbacteria bacterium RIFCSPHIGHO2_02_FULL_51_14]|uniref:tRNA (guanine-N(1)-)-methyltransferase n=1 Tax=Candidatus Magasanikbacteria bacterium RIFCSPHIGHO2_02_FULL_51_14 TaxID=1798683 RepID=A0A1F6MH91_9BACT|nr:MAG: tRNA (guanosine(37)-N1)-methyltransferase TrmD [Candidatus Magasanikbacteria bacterium RIFCSPHIGHO2_02_FULL_51_14]
MQFNIITIFPNLIADYCNESILGRAQKEKLISVEAIDLRDFTTDKHRTVDDTPYGGGAGMVMKVEPIFRALQSFSALSKVRSQRAMKLETGNSKLGKKLKISARGGSAFGGKNHKSILLSPRGRQFDQRMAEELSELQELTMVCGRYEGVDQRVSDYLVDEEISIGPYVLAGGELGALVVIEAVSRLIPGVLGNVASLAEETFSTQPPNHPTTQPHEKNKKMKIFRGKVVRCSGDKVIKEYPQYTKPAVFHRWKVPEVLLSGDHKKIADWRKTQGC